MLAHDNVTPVRVAAVILAAGGSTRLGQPKQLLRDHDETLVSRVARITDHIGCSPVVVVTGANASDVEAALESVPFAHPVFNPNWEMGMGSSIRIGVSAILSEEISFDAVLLLVCDQPLVSETLLLRIYEAYRDSGKQVIASEYGDVWGVPCLFDKTVLPELLALSGASGAKSVIERHRKTGDAITVPFPGGAFDVDTPDDWQRWQETQNIKLGEAT